MKKEKKGKIFIAWLALIFLIILILWLSFMKFFGTVTPNIEEKPVNNSSATAINNALKEITTNFNQNSKVKEYENNDITLKATVNNYSIFISYITDITITYEFTYNNLSLDIITNLSEEEQETFNIIYQILIEAVQKRLNNEENIETIITNFLTTEDSYNGLTKTKVDAGIKYQMNITKRIKPNE